MFLHHQEIHRLCCSNQEMPGIIRKNEKWITSKHIIPWCPSTMAFKGTVSWVTGPNYRSDPSFVSTKSGVDFGLSGICRVWAALASIKLAVAPEPIIASCGQDLLHLPHDLQPQQQLEMLGDPMAPDLGST